MNRGVKIFLWILGVLLVILGVLGIYAYYSYKQITAITTIANDESFQQNAVALAKGDCSKYSDVEGKYEEIKVALKDACANPGVKALMQQQIEKQVQLNGVNVSFIDVCNETNNPTTMYSQFLEQAKKNCNLTA